MKGISKGMTVLLMAFFSMSLYCNSSDAFFKQLDQSALKKSQIKKQFASSQESYNQAVLYLKQHKQELDLLEKELKTLKVEPAASPLDLKYRKTMPYLKLMSMATIQAIVENKPELIKERLALQVKFFKLMFEQKTLLSHMIGLVGELFFFENLAKVPSWKEHEKVKEKIKKEIKQEIKEGIKKELRSYRTYRENRFKTTMEGEVQFITSELLKESKHLVLRKKSIMNRVIAYMHEKEMLKIKALFQEGSKEKLSESKVYPPVTKGRLLKVYTIVFFDFLKNGQQKEYQIHDAYIHFLGDTLGHIASIPTSTYMMYQIKEKESLKKLDDLLK